MERKDRRIAITFEELIDTIGLSKESMRHIEPQLAHCIENFLILIAPDEKNLLVNIYEVFNIDDANKKISAKFSEAIANNIMLSEKDGVALLIKDMVSLRGVGAMRLYEICRKILATEKTQTKQYDDLMALSNALLLESPPDNWTDFSYKYLSKYVDDINRFTSINVSYKFIKKGQRHKIIGIIFSVSRKSDVYITAGEEEVDKMFSSFRARLSMSLIPKGFTEEDVDMIASIAYDDILKGDPDTHISVRMNECIDTIRSVIRKCPMSPPEAKLRWINNFIEFYF